MQSYGEFAYIYDKLMNLDIDYKKMSDYIEAVFDRCSVKPDLVLDLACGTGSLTNELAIKGYNMIGIDISADMLSVAQQKNSNILFLNQDMIKFELYGTVDAVVCMTDSINYITSDKDLEDVFLLVKNYLNPGAPFIFDINTKFKLSKIIGDNTFTFDNEDILYVWQNKWNSKTSIADFYLSFFIRQKYGLYRRFDEHHRQRAYSKDFILELLLKCGFKHFEAFDYLSFNMPKKDSSKYVFVAF